MGEWYEVLCAVFDAKMSFTFTVIATNRVSTGSKEEYTRGANASMAMILRPRRLAI
jgi:hypothetical protein